MPKPLKVVPKSPLTDSALQVTAFRLAKKDVTLLRMIAAKRAVTLASLLAEVIEENRTKWMKEISS